MKWFTFLICALFLALPGCDNRTSAVKGQVNATLTFYGKVVDQDARPLPDAIFEFALEAYPKDWTFETRGKPNDKVAVRARSDANGLFDFTVTGCTLRRVRAERAGYRHLFDSEGSNRAVENTWYRLIAWGDLLYQSDPDNPAVFVFVEEGVREVSALPCRGGSDSPQGKYWTTNKPSWPLEPSLKDVLRKQEEAKDRGG
ncbi:MAG TPA: hypothetical protein VF669_00630 [Tepidisphaeraceae bacterium]|jgi:hypothetical protein